MSDFLSLWVLMVVTAFAINLMLKRDTPHSLRKKWYISLALDIVLTAPFALLLSLNY